MEACPDVDRLIEVTVDEAPMYVAAHARSCPRCQDDLAWLRLIPFAIEGGDLEVPEELQQETLQRIRMLPVEDDGELSVAGMARSGALVVTTAGSALWMIGSMESARMPTS